MRTAARQARPVSPHQDELRSCCPYADLSSDTRPGFFSSLHNGPVPSGCAVLVPADRSVQADLGAVQGEAQESGQGSCSRCSCLASRACITRFVLPSIPDHIAGITKACAQQQRLSWLLGYMVAAFGHALALCEDGRACMSADGWLSMCRLNLVASVWASAVSLRQPQA